jgi:hypothetical protein
MFKSKKKLFQVAIPFSFFYITSILVVIFVGYIVKNDREIEPYKQLTLWYEKFDENGKEGGHTSEILSEFVNRIQDNLKNEYQSYFKTPERKLLPLNVKQKIIIDNNSPVQGSVTWTIGKTGESLKAYYGYTRVKDFNRKSGSNNVNRENEKKQSADDKVFQNFTDMMISQIQTKLDRTKNNDDGIKNLNTFSKVVFEYLTGNDKYSDKIPDLRIDNIYILNKKTGFMLSYPFTNQDYKEQIDFKTRPWFRATQKNDSYDSSFLSTDKFSNSLGLTGVYIDINDEKKPNAIRTLWYKFTTENNEEYFLCLDLFFDKSSKFANEENFLYKLEQSVKSLFNLKNSDNNWWVYLLIISLIMALGLSFMYEFIIKDFILKISQRHTKDLTKIKLQLESKHYASKDEGEIKFTIQGETTEINHSEQSREAKWSLDIKNIQIGVNKSQTQAQQQEVTSSYEFTKEYNLNMTQNRPQYRCIETWKVVLDSQLVSTQKIGFFVATWNTNNGADIEEGLEIKSIYWEKEYEEYLCIIKEQLRNHLLISDEKELVAVSDRNYSRHQKIPSFIKKIDSLEKTIKSSLYLKQGKIVFSEMETLIELYRQNQGMVNAICTLPFLRKLVETKKSKDFFQTKVNERYLIEYQQNEFGNFYNSLDQENQSELIQNLSQFKIMVYQDNIDNIVSVQDDFCIISINNSPKLVAYSFTDNKFSDTGWIGWISWREVDIKFYDGLYKCQKDKNVKKIKTTKLKILQHI